MSFDFEYYKIKMFYDLSAYLLAAGATFLFYQKYLRTTSKAKIFETPQKKSDYYLTVLAWAFGLGILASTLDNYLINPDSPLMLTKSVAAAIAGGVWSAELWKRQHGILQATGILFLPGIIVGLIWGRLGAFTIGLRDHTYGIPTSLPWGMDFGDGILRHPVQLYEIIVVTCAGLLLVAGMRWCRNFTLEKGFYIFTMIYFSYRFLGDFLKPYSTFWLGMNTYQVISIAMLVYSAKMLSWTSVEK